MPKLTKRKMDALAPADREYVAWDDDLHGFGCRVHPSGRKTFVFKYRVGGGRNGLQRKMTLGLYCEAFTVDQARGMAREKANLVSKGEDPARQRQEHRAAETLEEFSKRYIREHATPMKKAASVKGDQWLLDRHILPNLGSRKVVDMTPADITKILHSIAHRPSRKRADRGKLVPTPILANRVRSLLSKMMALAIAWNVRRDPVNPVHGVVKFPERSRERFLLSNEIKRLGEVLRAVGAEATEPWQAITAIRLLLLTGCRRGEILSLKWEFIDRDNQVLLLPESKTGRKTVYLTTPVLEMLDALPRKEGCPFVLPARFEADGHFQGIGHVWARIRKSADLDNVRIHDLRHTFASTGVSLRVGLPLLGGLLGHAQASTTEKYAHLAADPTRKAGARIARQLRADLGPTSNVISFVGPKNRNKAEPTVQSVRSVRKAQKSGLTEPMVEVDRVSGVPGPAGR